MRIIKRGALEQFWREHPDAKAGLESWYAVMRKADWKTPAELRQVYPNADLVGRRTVFNIAGKKVPTDRVGQLPNPAGLRPLHFDPRRI
jgi:mRNA interferase HigB